MAGETTYKRRGQINRSLLLGCMTLLLSTDAFGSGASMLLKQLGKYAGKQSAKEGGETLTKEAGEALANRVAKKLAEDGSEASLEAAGRLVASGGPDVLRTIDGLADPKPVMRAMGALPEDEVAVAASRLVAGSSGKELAELTGKYGVDVLRAEVKHPGLATKLVGNLGQEGAELATKLAPDQAVAVAKHADDIGKLPGKMRSDLIAAIGRQPGKFTAAMGRFVRDNPGKVLFSASGTALILANPDAFLGSLNPDGEMTPGLIDRTLDKTVTPVVNGAIWILIPALAVAAFILLLRFWHLTSWLSFGQAAKSKRNGSIDSKDVD